MLRLGEAGDDCVLGRRLEGGLRVRWVNREETYCVFGGISGAGGYGCRCAAGLLCLHLVGEALGGGGVDVEEADAVGWRKLGLEISCHLVSLASSQFAAHLTRESRHTIWPSPIKA